VRGFWAWLLLISLPLAILATKTRAAWLSFAISMLWFMVRSGSPRLRRACTAAITITAIASLTLLEITNSACAFTDRLNDKNTVEFRIAAYQAGWRMFLDWPFTGWGADQIQSELATRVDQFRGESFAVHNTYLEVLLEHGVLGFTLYLWIIAGLFRLRKIQGHHEHTSILVLRNLWPLLLAVYFVNAAFVVMSYQFVNCLFFTLAGILAANSNPGQNSRFHFDISI
jgi:O-antigen ligase